MFLYACSTLLFVALLLNLGDRRMLALTAVVGVIFLIPAPVASADQFYSYCIVAEVGVAAAALLIRAAATEAVIEACVLLVAAHVMGYILDGSHPLSPYHVLVKILEFVQIAACAVFSPAVMPLLRNQNAKT